MLVTYKTTQDILLTRPQTALPTLGHHVVLTPEGGEGRRYRVVEVEWPLRVPPRAYYSLTDEADVHVHVLLVPCRASEEDL